MIDPALPIDMTDPTLPIDNTESREPIERIERSDHSDHRDRLLICMRSILSSGADQCIWCDRVRQGRRDGLRWLVSS
jgi:hypothetical protein